MSLIAPNIWERRTPKEKLALIGAALLLILVIAGLAWWAYSGPTQKEIDLNNNIANGMGQNAVIDNLVRNAEINVRNAEQIANNANAALGNSILRDSNSFSGNATDAFCERFPGDSTCSEWRERYR